MLSHFSVTILIDSFTKNNDLFTEHGFSVWIEADDKRILFDTGQSDILVHNAAKLGIDLSSADALVLSHGHYDHIGGVASILSLEPSIPVYCHSAIFSPHHSRKPDGLIKPIGVSINKQSSDSLHKIIDSINWVDSPAYLTSDIGITGSIPRNSLFEDTGGAFFLDCEGRKTDPIEDDLAMWFRTVHGIYVITGCSHSGLINTLMHILTINKGESIHAVIGGFHLLNATSYRIEKTCDYIKSTGIEQIVPCHCTGTDAIEILKERLGSKILNCYAGIQFCFNANS